MQQCLYLRPLPQGHGSFLPIFARAWRGITLRHYRAGLWKGKGDTRWLFFREENRRVQINACSTRRAVTLQPPPAPVPDLPQTRERVRRRYDCQPQTISEAFSSLGNRTGRTAVSGVTGDSRTTRPITQSRQGIKVRMRTRKSTHINTSHPITQYTICC